MAIVRPHAPPRHPRRGNACLPGRDLQAVFSVGFHEAARRPGLIRRWRPFSAAGKYALPAEPPAQAARSAAFRRIVSENYDYRCAASGWRIILPEGRVMVAAAHLIPFAETRDDDPRNGIALAPTFHWALDAHIIAPGPDYLWHVSKALDERVADNQPLRRSCMNWLMYIQ